MDHKDTKRKALYAAQLVGSGKRVQVYRHHSGSYIDYSDCSTEYRQNEIVILNEIKS